MNRSGRFAGRAARVVAGLVAMASLASCIVSGPVRSTISTGPDGFRTFTVARADGGQPILCNPSLSLPEFIGTLAGQAGAQDPVWVAAEDGRTMVVVWPAGFSVRFNPEVELLDDKGQSVAKAGETVKLGVGMNSAAGTHDDPYIASGIVFDGCYIYSP